MAKLVKTRAAFYRQCPGCKQLHPIPHGHGKDWEFNNDFDKPTFSPSVLQYPHMHADENGHRAMSKRCHYFIKEGRIEFCGDSEHELAGKIVDLPDHDFPAWMRE